MFNGSLTEAAPEGNTLSLSMMLKSRCSSYTIYSEIGSSLSTDFDFEPQSNDELDEESC